MLIWFAAVSFLIVAQVFDSPALDYRVVMFGAVLPFAEGLLGGPWVLHTLLGSVVLLAVVMAVTMGRRLVRRRWLGLPIGTFLHLALDGTWADSDLFWWPLTGGTLGEGRIPELDHLAVSLLLEAVGIGVGVWAFRRYGLDDPARWARFRSTGQLSRDLM